MPLFWRPAMVFSDSSGKLLNAPGLGSVFWAKADELADVFLLEETPEFLLDLCLLY